MTETFTMGWKPVWCQWAQVDGEWVAPEWVTRELPAGLVAVTEHREDGSVWSALMPGTFGERVRCQRTGDYGPEVAPIDPDTFFVNNG